MNRLDNARQAFERLLEAIVIVLMVAMFLVIVAGVSFRKAGAALVWYDEVAEVLLCWLTYYGAALAALKRAHIGVPTLVRMAPEGVRRLCFVVAEGTVFAFFALFAWAGARILPALEFDFMTTIPEISTQYTYSVIPIGAVLYMIAQALSLPKAWRKSIAPDSAPLTH